MLLSSRFQDIERTYDIIPVSWTKYMMHHLWLAFQWENLFVHQNGLFGFILIESIEAEHDSRGIKGVSWVSSIKLRLTSSTIELLPQGHVKVSRQWAKNNQPINRSTDPICNFAWALQMNFYPHINIFHNGGFGINSSLQALVTHSSLVTYNRRIIDV